MTITLLFSLWAFKWLRKYKECGLQMNHSIQNLCSWQASSRETKVVHSVWKAQVSSALQWLIKSHWYFSYEMTSGHVSVHIQLGYIGIHPWFSVSRLSFTPVLLAACLWLNHRSRESKCVPASRGMTMCLHHHHRPIALGMLLRDTGIHVMTSSPLLPYSSPKQTGKRRGFGNVVNHPHVLDDIIIGRLLYYFEMCTSVSSNNEQCHITDENSRGVCVRNFPYMFYNIITECVTFTRLRPRINEAEHTHASTRIESLPAYAVVCEHCQCMWS